MQGLLIQSLILVSHWRPVKSGTHWHSNEIPLEQFPFKHGLLKHSSAKERFDDIIQIEFRVVAYS